MLYFLDALYFLILLLSTYLAFKLSNQLIGYYLTSIMLLEIITLASVLFHFPFNISGINNVYPVLSLFFIFFLYKNHMHYMAVFRMMGSLALAAILFFLVHHKGWVKPNVSATLSFILFIFIAIPYWFLSEIMHVNEVPLPRKPLFWWSVGWLLWSTYYIFRVLPMYYLNSIDQKFLMALTYGNKIVNIITYTLFLQGILCLKKQDYRRN